MKRGQKHKKAIPNKRAQFAARFGPRPTPKRAPKPAYTPKGPSPVSDVAKDALRLIRDRVVRASGLAAYYWSDWYMQAIAWLDRGVLRFLKARHMIHKGANGVYRLTELAMKLLAPVPARRLLAAGNSLSDSEKLRLAAAHIGARTVTT